MVITFFSLILLIFSSVSILCLFWFTHCNQKTADQRQQIIDWVFAHKNYSELRDYYSAVSYDQHLYTLMKFKNPFELYDPELFSTFHMVKHGPAFKYITMSSKELICPYTPKG